MFSRFFKTQPAMMVGVDIGTTEVKAIALSETAGGYQLEAATKVTLPRGAVVDREIKDPEAVAQAMAQLRTQLPEQAKWGIASVSGSAVMTKVIQMDASLSDEELEAQIEVEADSLIPYPQQEVNIDFQVLRRNDIDPSKNDVLLAACRSDKIDSRVDALDSAELEAKIIDIEGYALGRSAKLITTQISGGTSDKTIGLVDIGASMITFAIVKQGETVFIREQPFGGEQYTQSILAYYAMTFDEAERAKLDHQLPRGYDMEVLGPFQMQLLQQVRRALQIFSSNESKDETVDHLILSGGSCAVEGIVELLATELNIPVAIADPMNHGLKGSEFLYPELTQTFPSYMVACGLALRSLEPWHI